MLAAKFYSVLCYSASVRHLFCFTGCACVRAVRLPCAHIFVAVSTGQGPVVARSGRRPVPAVDCVEDVAKADAQGQRAKLKLEEAITSQSAVTYSIVRPTAFFKSLAGQVPARACACACAGAGVAGAG